MERLTSTEFLYGFDLLELNGDDLRGQLLERRKAKLERLLTGRTGVRLSEHIEGDGAIIFKHASKMGAAGRHLRHRARPVLVAPHGSASPSLRC